MSRILTIAFTASLVATSVEADPSPPAATPRTRTEGLLKCRLGIGPTACGKNDGCNGGDGPLEKVEYLGANAAGDDVYAVRYMHANSTFVISPPGPDGQIRRIWVNSFNPNMITPSPVAGIPPQAIPVLIYTRPENSPAAGCREYPGNPNPPY